MIRTVSSIGTFITNTLNGISAVGSMATNSMDTWFKTTAEKQKTISIMEMNQEIKEAADKYRTYLQQFSAEERAEIDALIEQARNYKF